jgi:O-antigen ligase
VNSGGAARAAGEPEALDSGDDTGPIGPVAISAFLFLMVAAPLMRGGNRNVALIVLEGAALAFLAAFAARGIAWFARPTWREGLVAALVLSPLWLAVVYLLPLPAGAWSAAEGRDAYVQFLQAAGIDRPGWLALSLVPDATSVSLFAGIPLMAAFLAGYAARLDQLKLVLKVLVGLAFLQILLGLLQLAGGGNSSLNFGAAPGRVYGTFANPNHFANYIAMALAAYVWLAWARLAPQRFALAHAHGHPHSFARTAAMWGAGALFLVVGVLMSRSRGAALAGLPAAMGAIALALTLGARVRSWRTTFLLLGGALAAAIALVGFDALVARFDIDRMVTDAPLRTMQAATTLEGAWAFWPWGTGWGTYYEVYPRFQPPALVGTADYAHHDYAQMLFEGGLFAVLLMLAFAILAATRTVALARAVMRRGRLRREEMLCAICGIGLLGFLLHSFVEFNMHIPANAIVASLLAGVFLRPLPQREAEDTADD